MKKLSKALMASLSSWLAALSALIIILPFAAVVAAEQEEIPTRPKIGLALGGGGAKGAAHVGILRVLEELHIPVDYVAGSSMGSIVAALYASGMSPDDIERNLLAIDWNDVMRDKPPRQELSYWRKQDDGDYLIKRELGLRDGKVQVPRGLILGQKFGVLLKWFTLHVSGVTDFNQLPIPFRAVAVDVADGTVVSLASGNLADAIRASAALPGIFAPVQIGDRLLIDGALAKNLPIDEVRKMGADVVIAVDVGTQYAPVEQLKSALDISSQAMLITTRRDVDRQIATLDKQDVFLAPPLSAIDTLEFNKSAEAIRLGEATAREQVERLRKFSVADAQWQAWVQKHRIAQDRELRVDRVTVRNRSAVPDASIARQITIQPGDVLSLEGISREINAIYGMGDFERVGFSVEVRDVRNELVFEPVAKSWGPNYVRFGLNIEDDFDGNSRYQIALNHHMTQLNAYGGEWKNTVQIGYEQRVLSEFFQPLGYGSDYFLLSSVSARRFVTDVPVGADTIAYSIRGGAVQVSAGLQLGPNLGAIYAGLHREWLRGSPKVKSTGLESVEANVGGVFAAFSYDQLDNVSFPKSGSEASFGVEMNRDWFESDDDYDKLGFAAARFATWGAHTFLLGLRLASSAGSELPFYDRFALGGFSSLSGYQSGALEGNYLALGKAVYWQRVGGGGQVLDGIYLGATVESGNVWNDRDEINSESLIFAGSVFVGLDTAIGPIYLAYGRAENSVESLYFFLGKTF